MPSDSTRRAANIAGLRSFDTPTIEAVERRRLQLWLMTLTLLASVTLGLVLLTLWRDVPASGWFTLRQLQIGLLSLVALFSAYAIEKEVQLRRLTRLLIDERVLTSALTNRAQELTSLLTAAKAMNLVTDLETVLETILSSCMDLLEGRDGSIMLAGPANELCTVATCGSSQARGARLRIGEGVAGTVAATREPHLVSGCIPPETRAQPYSDAAAPPSSSMSAPLVHHGELLGVLNINAAPGRVYTEYDLRAMSLFGEHAAGAVANAMLLDEQRLLASRSVYQARHDPLTHLPNRGILVDRIEHALARRRQAGHLVAVAFIDLDDFKQINDSLGHSAGDEVLIACADRLRGAVRSGDSIARFGGDEFVALVEDVTSSSDAVHAAERLADTLTEPFLVGGREVSLRASIGIAIESSDGGSTANDLIRNADTANHAAKRAGKDRVVVFEPHMHTEVLDRVDLEDELRHAIDAANLTVHFQPVLTLRERSVRSFEALVRWPHPGRGVLPAAAFVPLAEQAGLLAAIDRWVLRHACTLASSLPGLPGQPGPPPISVNLSPASLFDRRLPDEIEAALAASDLRPECLTIEITEDGITHDARRGAAVVADLRAMGVRFALDDFGSGHSSLSHLSTFRVDTIKIDRVFSAGVPREASTRALVQAIVRLAQSLGIEVIATGVENGEQAACLADLGCTLGQGFGLCPPLPAEEIAAFLANPART